MTDLTRRFSNLAVAVVALVAVQQCRTAWAAFPGENGKICFTDYTQVDVSGQVAVVPPEAAGEVTPLTSEGTLNEGASWSPDGTRIAFSSTRDDGNTEIYAMNADGSDQQRLTENAAFDYLPDWSADGQTLLFSSNRDGDFEIYRMSATGGEAIQYTSSNGFDGVAAWSPDCSKIVFSSQRDGDFEIFTMNGDGSGQTQLTFNTENDLYDDWSPDGQQIAFATERAGTVGRDIWVMNADGSEQHSLISRAGGDTDPAFSPDGTLISFAADNQTNFDSIYVASAVDGGDLVHVTEPGTHNHRSPDWQPVVAQEGINSVECPPFVICGDANIDFRIKATDALLILKAAVGQPIPCELVRCDTDDGGKVLSSDAQRVLRRAVGLPAVLNCPKP